MIGLVGSLGYGLLGIVGKFLLYFYYGMYKDNGKIEWLFDLYLYL